MSDLWKKVFFPVFSMTQLTGDSSGLFDSLRTRADEALYQPLMFSLTDRTDIVLAITACCDAQIALSEIPGVFAHRTYEVVIGSQDNTKTEIRGSVGGSPLYEVNTPQILNCNASRLFWITWSSGTISVGTGSVPQQDRLLYFQDPQWHPVNSMSVMTPAGVAGTWQTSGFVGKH